jgi:hypothetical protein
MGMERMELVHVVMAAGLVALTLLDGRRTALVLLAFCVAYRPQMSDAARPAPRASLSLPPRRAHKGARQ